MTNNTCNSSGLSGSESAYLVSLLLWLRPLCPVQFEPPKICSATKVSVCSHSLWMSLRCCQKYASSTDSSTGRESISFFQITFPMPDFTFTVSLANWLKPRLAKQEKRATLNIPLKWKIRLWWSSVGWGGNTWIQLDALLFSISLNLDQDATATLRCVAEFGIGTAARKRQLYQPPTTFSSSCPLL